MKTIACLAILAGAASAADIAGPIAGYVAGSPRVELRAILGVPGSFRFSDPLALPDSITRIRLAPGQDFALVERKDAAAAVMVLAGAAVDHVTAIDGALASADWVIFSTSGHSAVFSNASANRLQVMTGLPDAPRITLDLNTTSLPEPVLTAAVSDDASLVAVASNQSVYVLPRATAPQLLFSGAAIASVALLPNRADLIVADRGAGSVFLLHEGVARALASGLDGIGHVVPSHDGAMLFATIPGAVAAIDLASGAVRSFEAAVGPGELAGLRNWDTFLISARPRQPAWVFFRDGDGGRFVFIPAIRGMQERAR